jgi:hypothetical protein
VTEFHRLPEHPGDYRGEVCCPLEEQPDDMELISMSSTFINGAEREVKARKAHVKKFLKWSWDDIMEGTGTGKKEW